MPKPGAFRSGRQKNRARPRFCLAQSLRQAAVERQGGAPADDMSVIVLRIDRRGEGAQSSSQADIADIEAPGVAS